MICIQLFVISYEPILKLLQNYYTHYKLILTLYKVVTPFNVVCYILQTNAYLTQSLYNIICYPVYINAYLVQSWYNIVLLPTTTYTKVVITLFVTYYTLVSYPIQSCYNIICYLLQTNTYLVQSCYNIFCYLLQTRT